MDYKRTGAEKTTITRDVEKLRSKTGNIFKSLSIVAKRSSQINSEIKQELTGKLEEFATNYDQLEEVFENTEQIAVSRFYERLPKPWAIALKELIEEEVYMRDLELESDSETKPEDAKG